MPKSPYDALPKRAFWRTGVVDRQNFNDFYSPRFKIDRNMKIATAGSCFAQHVGRALRQNGFTVIDAEPSPSRVNEETSKRYGFNLYSARYGNIYTVRQLVQLWREANSGFVPALSAWEKDGRYYDSQRPTIEPGGFETKTALAAHRALHLDAVRRAFGSADVFVFTFGLTEAWQHLETQTVYPTCPGTVAGHFDPSLFGFINFSFGEILADFISFRSMMLKINPDLKFLLTVSPVPLTATASGAHVEVATSYSKAVLRAVCGQLVNDFDDVDYFPSFEMITSQRNAGRFYNANLREVTAEGVSTAMNAFLLAHGAVKTKKKGSNKVGRSSKPIRAGAAHPDLVCEEALLEAFIE